jgi:hypothetical protein
MPCAQCSQGIFLVNLRQYLDANVKSPGEEPWQEPEVVECARQAAGSMDCGAWVML